MLLDNYLDGDTLAFTLSCKRVPFATVPEHMYLESRWIHTFRTADSI